MKEFTKGTGKGQWWPLYYADEKRKSATIVCPDCGKDMALGHKINNDGVTSQSVVCPHQCKFHDYIKLIGWEPISEGI